MNKTKILFLINTLSGGGAERVLINTVNNMNKEKFDITVQTLYNKGGFIEKLDKCIKYKSVVKHPDSYCGKMFTKFVCKSLQMFNSKTLHRMYIHGKYDCEIAFLEGGPNKIISGANKKKRTISWVHIDLINNPASEFYYNGSKGEEKTYKTFDRIVFVSKRCKDSFNKKYPGMDEKTIVIYNPIDVNQIREMAQEAVEDINKDGFIICSIGRLTSQKAYSRLVNIHNKLLKEGIEHKIWLIGTGEEKEKLEKLINGYGVQDTFLLLGFKENPYKYLAKCDLFVSSSIAEGFPLVICEAITLKIPIVATDCAGMEELLGNGKQGIITKNDEEELYKGIKNIILDKKKYNIFKNNTDDSIEKIFDLPVIINNIETTILEVINENINNSK